MSPLLRRVELDRINREHSRQIEHDSEHVALCEALFFAVAGGLLILLAYVALVV